jgi:hypothetical protein
VKLRGTILFLAVTLAALGAGWLGFPRVIYRTQAQPVDFSHKIHADKASMKCEDCHAFRSDGTFAGVPTLDKCSTCHAAAMGDTAAEKQFIEKYVTPQREPVWLVNARQPANAYFPHGPHVNRAKLACERCHNVQAASATLPPHQEDRISGYSRGLITMDGCIDCHHQNHTPERSCLDCHK